MACQAISHSGKHIATASRDQSRKLRDARDKSLGIINAHNEKTTSMTLSHTANTLLQDPATIYFESGMWPLASRSLRSEARWNCLDVNC